MHSVLRRCVPMAGLVLALGSAAMAHADVPPAPLPAGQLGVHLVRPGESLLHIAGRYGMPVAELARLNGTAPQGILWPGRAVWIPLSHLPAHAAAGTGLGTGAAGPTAGGGLAEAEGAAADPAADSAGPAVPAPRAAIEAGLHVVAPGDTLSAIARAHGLGLAELVRLNGMDQAAVLLPGQTLRLPPRGVGPGGGGAKRIEIDIGEQRMYVWEGESLAWSFVASTGMAGYPTRRGRFQVQSKIDNAWSSAWQLWMPHWLGIYWAGGSENGIHALPIINGQQLWGGYLGSPISYGCIVLDTGDAAMLYDWADIGTPVEIRD